MKILITTGIYPPDIGGPSTYSKLLFDKLPERGIEVEVLSFGEVRYLPKIIRHFVYFLKILKRARKADIIYVQDPVSVGLPTMLANKILGKRFLIRIAGDYAWEQGVQRFRVKDNLDDFCLEYNKYNWQVKILKKIQTKVALSAERIIVPSKYFKGIIKNWGVTSEKIKVIYNGIELSKDLEILSPSDDKVLLSVGRLVPWKGFSVLIESMPEILRYHPNLKLMIVGEGPQREELETLIKLNKLEDKVILAGKLPREETLKEMQKADIFILNTQYEGFAHQLIEVASLGTSIITTNIGGNPELIQNDIDGILVEPDNKKQIVSAINKILINDDFRGRIIQNAFNKSKRFSIEKTLDNLEQILKH